MAEELRALSLSPPWTWAVFDLGKTVENRSRKGAKCGLPSRNFRGRVAIHASGLPTRREFSETVERCRASPWQIIADDGRNVGCAREEIAVPESVATRGRAGSIGAPPAPLWVPGVAWKVPAIVGVVDVVGIVLPGGRAEIVLAEGEVTMGYEDRRDFEGMGTLIETRQLTKEEGRWYFGGWAYLLARPRKLAKPVPCKGALGVWRVPPGVAKRVLEQLS